MGNGKMNCAGCDVSQLLDSARDGRRPEFDYFHYSTARTAFTSGQNQLLSVPFFPDSYFVGKKLVATSSGTFSCRIVNGATGRVLNDIRVNNANLFGTIQLPNELKDPLIMPPSSQLQLDILDTSGAGNTIQVVFVGYRWFNLANPPRAGKPGSFLQWYQYTASVVLTANGQGIVQTRIDADGDFLVRKLVGTQTGAYTLRVSDSTSTDSWFDQEQANANVVGTAQYPNVLAKPKLIRRNSTITSEFRDLSGSTNTIQLVYEGSRVYRG